MTKRLFKISEFDTVTGKFAFYKWRADALAWCEYPLVKEKEANGPEPINK